MKGLYVVVETIDGGGKGAILKGFKKYHEEKKEDVFDLELSWTKNGNLKKWYGTNNILPNYKSLIFHLNKEGINPEAFIVAEPTFEGLGKIIREEATNTDLSKNFNSEQRINLFAENRLNLLKNFILPALDDGKNIYSSRNITSSLVYQSTELNCDYYNIINKHPGNIFAMANLPKYTIINSISIDMSTKLLNLREKKDDSMFENKSFQSKIRDKYLSKSLKKLLESYGSEVIYIDIPEESTEKDTINKAYNLIKKLDV
ncbi:MAG: hypothetical protein ACMXX9_04870 [Candidatus Woesearchaeota archaeon]